jgi:hypothetical protein
MYIIMTDILLLTVTDKGQTHPLATEAVPQGQDSSSQTEFNVWGSTDQLTVSRNVTLTY